MLFFGTTASFGQDPFVVTDEQPFLEDFSGDNVFDYWTMESVGAGHWSVMLGSTGNYGAVFSYTDVGDESRLISPVLDLSALDAATFSFTYSMVGMYSNDELLACYRSSADDEWHTLGTYSISDYVNYYEAQFDLPDLSPTYQISFLARGLGGLMLMVSNISVVSAQGCPRPISLQVSEITPFSALLDWSTEEGLSSWIIELNGEETKVLSHPYLMENLTPQTEYTFRVKAQCGEEMESQWSTPLSFTTACDVIIVTDEEPYFDDFEASEDFVCWMNEITTGNADWVIDLGYVIPNHTAFFIWMGGDALLISAPLNLTAVTHPSITFKHRQPQGEFGEVDELSVWYRTMPDEDWKLVDFYINPAEDWEEVTLALPDASDKYQVAFLGVSHDGEGVYVDDVKIGNNETWRIDETIAVKAVATPNPTHDHVVIATNATNGKVTLFDLWGRQVVSATLFEGRAEIDASSLAPGIYTAHVASEQGTATVRFIKE